MINTMVILNRFTDDGKQTLGTLTVQNSKELFVCKTLELGWHDNANNISCIPEGEYTCKWTRSNRLTTAAGHDVFTYEVLNVPNRAGIRIHSANYFYQLLGCIALGDAHKDINADGHLDANHSGATVAKFAEVMGYGEFRLTVE